MVCSKMLRFPNHFFILAAFVLASASGCIFGESALAQAAAALPAAGKAADHGGFAGHDGYVGSAACARCHRSISTSFAKASMGHALTAITPEFLKTLPLGSPQTTSVFDAKSNHRFEVHAENGKLIQSEYETGASGQEVFRSTHEMGWIIGTGENGFGALLRRGDYLFQAPLSLLHAAARWDLSPGYQNEDYGFNRVIQPGCIYCHSGRPQPIAGHDGSYRDPAFTQTSIGCENCHGPGAAHIEAMRKGKIVQSGADPTIVNPALLSGQLANDICMSCHQGGDARVLQPGKTYQDFRPGEPLERTVAIFQIPPTRDNPPNEDHVEHYYSMSLSKCFLGTRNLPRRSSYVASVVTIRTSSRLQRKRRLISTRRALPATPRPVALRRRLRARPRRQPTTALAATCPSAASASSRTPAQPTIASCAPPTNRSRT